MRAASLIRRFAALIYESLLIGSVTVLAGIASGIINTVIGRITPTLSPLTPILTSVIFVVSWWAYFLLNWQIEGQILAMRVWKIGLTDLSGSRPTVKRLWQRFAWATVFVVFMPLLAYQAAQGVGIHGKLALVLALSGWILPWGFALFSPRRQFLYDYLAGTELVDLRTPK